MRIDVKHFLCEIENGIATVRLNRPDRKNPLTFDSYAELRDWFRDLTYADDVDVVIFASNGGNFSSGGDVHDIIGPLTRMNMKDLLRFTRMTGDLVKAIVNCGKPVIAAVDGICVGAGAIIAMASDLRLATPQAKTAFLFTRVGLAGSAMSVLDVFRSTVAAAALGFARRALDEAAARVGLRQVQGAPLADLQMVQGRIADMAVDVDASALLAYRAAWAKDSGAARVTRGAAMAKLFATDHAQQVIDMAVQLHGGDGVRQGETVERLYREIMALRIYEGASDVQRAVIARQTLGGNT